MVEVGSNFNLVTTLSWGWKNQSDQLFFFWTWKVHKSQRQCQCTGYIWESCPSLLLPAWGEWQHVSIVQIWIFVIKKPGHGLVVTCFTCHLKKKRWCNGHYKIKISHFAFQQRMLEGFAWALFTMPKKVFCFALFLFFLPELAPQFTERAVDSGQIRKDGIHRRNQVSTHSVHHRWSHLASVSALIPKPTVTMHVLKQMQNHARKTGLQHDERVRKWEVRPIS